MIPGSTHTDRFPQPFTLPRLPPAVGGNSGIDPAVAFDEADGPSTLPFTVFCVFTFILVGRPQDYIPQLAPFRIALLSTAVTCFVTFFQARQPTAISPFRTRESKLYFVLFAAMCAGTPFSIYRHESFNFIVFHYVNNLIFFVLFLIHVDSVAKYKRFVFVLLCSSLAFTVYQLRAGQVEDGRFAAESLVFDPNDVAFVEVCLLSFAMFTIFAGYRRVTKLAAVLSVVLGSLMALFTASRGGLLGLATLFFVFMLFRVPRVGKSLKLVLFLSVIAIAALNATRINMERYRTIGSLEDDYNFEEFGRADLWLRGLQMFAGSPITGVGVDGFPAALGMMRARERREPRWQTTHSAYVQVLSETGLLGTIPFLLLIVRTMRTFNGFRHAKLDGDAALVPVMLMIGFAAMLVSAAFLSQGYSLYFTMFFAAAAAINANLLGAGPALAAVESDDMLPVWSFRG